VSYLRDPAAIYAQSFATIEAEADLSALPAALHAAGIRMIHACGMVDLAADIVGDPAVAAAARDALRAGAPVLCDCEMVRSGIIRRYLPETTELILTLNDAEVPALATSLGHHPLRRGRRALAAAPCRGRRPHRQCPHRAVPSHRADRRRRPATGSHHRRAGGFRGAAESKALLASDALSIPFLTVRGRRGGSAIASAAFNAISKDLA
jgi:precorrin-8X/cobalt-precorrin-8 methylmutase